MLLFIVVVIVMLYCGVVIHLLLNVPTFVSKFETVFVCLGSFEEQFPKLLLDGGKVAAPLKSDEADAIGKVGLNGLKFFFSPHDPILFCNFDHLNSTHKLKLCFSVTPWK